MEKAELRESVDQDRQNRDRQNRDLHRGLGRTLFYVKGLPISAFSIVLAGIASVGGFIFGYDTGQISDMLIMDDFLTRFGDCDPITGVCRFSNVRSGLIVGLLSIGTLFGAIGGATVADVFGRRNAMSLECVVFTVGIVIQLASIDAWYQVAIGRLIAGVGVGGLSAAVPMYQAETAPAQIRGSLTATYQLFITFGLLVAYCICIGTRTIDGPASWRTVVGIGLVFSTFLGVTIQFMPESPRWCTRNGKVDQARAAVAKVRALSLDDSIVTTEMDEILNSIEVELGVSKERFIAGDAPTMREVIVAQGGGGSTYREVLKQWFNLFKGYKRGSSRIGYRTVLGISLQAFQQLTGANYFFYYGATVFQSVGIDDSFVTQIILGAVNFVMTFPSLWILERFGRRNPLICGGIWQSVWLFCFAAAGTAKDPTEDKGIGKFMIVTTCFFIAGFAMTWGPAIWILMGETFPTYTRARQGALGTASNWLWNFLIAFFTPFITSAIDFSYGFVFASGNFLGMLVVFFFLYESSGLTLENVDLMYRDPNSLPWKSRSWYPAGYNSRAEVEAETRKVLEEKKQAETRRILEEHGRTVPAKRDTSYAPGSDSTPGPGHNGTMAV